MLEIEFDNSYARDLPGLYAEVQPARSPSPDLLFLNAALADELGLDAQALAAAPGIAVLAGNAVPPGAQPIAQAYAGHQFGGFSPQLGDGRALLLGEVIDRNGQRRDIAIKGSGRTPYSRGGDGRAAVGPMLREVLISEGMHALGIPTTRALAVVATGEPVVRDAMLPGALLTRIAASHLRVGTFQFFAARGEIGKLQRLFDYAVARHDADLVGAPDAPLAFLRAVAKRQASLIAQWMNIGFIHGVMNTDNMTISGETIDYGPCAFMEAVDPATVFSSIDHQGRYAYGNQPAIAQWNLARLAEALLPLIAKPDDKTEMQAAIEKATAVIDAWPGWFAAARLKGQRAKLGLLAPEDLAEVLAQDPAAGAAESAAADPATDQTLADDFLALLQQHQVDHTLGWRRLCDAADGDANPLRALFGEASVVDPWLQRWQARCGPEDVANVAPAVRASRMRRVNPFVIPRNHRVEEALAAATAGEMQPFNDLLVALRDPWAESVQLAGYAAPASAVITAAYQTYCGT
ncbi:MAG: protein adenylyltransferase SelO [Rubrivivax sp.]